ncbi:GMC family oxidoreductase, partial [Mesorhizobium sp. M1406]
MTNPDIVIIGSGIGGATIASGLAGRGGARLVGGGCGPQAATPQEGGPRWHVVDRPERPQGV